MPADLRPIVALAILASATVASIDAAIAAGSGVVGSEGRAECRDALRSDVAWSPPERWAWSERVCRGLEADFYAYEPSPGALDAAEAWLVPQIEKDAPDRVRIRPLFLETVLFSRETRAFITRHGLAIRGAHFGEKVDLSNGVLDFPLFLEDSTFAAGIDATDLEIASHLILDGSHFGGPLAARRLRVDGNLFIAAGAELDGKLDLTGARITGNLVAGPGCARHEPAAADEDGRCERVSSFKGPVAAANARVGGSVYMSGSRFDSLNLTNADVAGEVSIAGSAFGDAINAYGISVRRDLRLGSDSSLAKVDLQRAVVGGSLYLDRANVAETVDLAGAKIQRDLVLASDKGSVRWERGATLRLRNASAGGLQDAAAAWDHAATDLQGFVYDSFGTVDGSSGSLADRGFGWIARWIEPAAGSGEAFMPQPYQHLADTLRRQGYYGLADRTIIELNERYRSSPTPGVLEYIVLSAAAAVDYGKSVERALLVFLFLAILGAVLFHRTEEGRKLGGWGDALLFSFDSLLPAVTLRKRHEDIEIREGVRYYFYLMRIAGYLFVFVLLKSFNQVINQHGLF